MDTDMFVEWMEIRLAQKTGSVTPEDALRMSKVIQKYKDNLGLINKVAYTEEELSSLNAAKIVYLLNL